MRARLPLLGIILLYTVLLFPLLWRWGAQPLELGTLALSPNILLFLFVKLFSLVVGQRVWALLLANLIWIIGSGLLVAVFVRHYAQPTLTGGPIPLSMGLLFSAPAILILILFTGRGESPLSLFSLLLFIQLWIATENWSSLMRCLLLGFAYAFAMGCGFLAGPALTAALLLLVPWSRRSMAALGLTIGVTLIGMTIFGGVWTMGVMFSKTPELIRLPWVTLLQTFQASHSHGSFKTVLLHVPVALMALAIAGLAAHVRRVFAAGRTDPFSLVPALAIVLAVVCWFAGETFGFAVTAMFSAALVLLAMDVSLQRVWGDSLKPLQSFLVGLLAALVFQGMTLRAGPKELHVWLTIVPSVIAFFLTVFVMHFMVKRGWRQTIVPTLYGVAMGPGIALGAVMFGLFKR